MPKAGRSRSPRKRQLAASCLVHVSRAAAAASEETRAFRGTVRVKVGRVADSRQSSFIVARPLAAQRRETARPRKTVAHCGFTGLMHRPYTAGAAMVTRCRRSFIVARRGRGNRGGQPIRRGRSSTPASRTGRFMSVGGRLRSLRRLSLRHVVVDRRPSIAAYLRPAAFSRRFTAVEVDSRLSGFGAPDNLSIEVGGQSGAARSGTPYPRQD